MCVRACVGKSDVCRCVQEKSDYGVYDFGTSEFNDRNSVRLRSSRRVRVRVSANGSVRVSCCVSVLLVFVLVFIILLCSARRDRARAKRSRVCFHLVSSTGPEKIVRTAN